MSAAPKKPCYFYSARFYDDEECVRKFAEHNEETEDVTLYEYRYVVPLDNKFRQRYLTLNKRQRDGQNDLLTEKECAAVGIVQSPGWQHVAFFDGFQTLVFRRPRTDSAGENRA